MNQIRRHRLVTILFVLVSLLSMQLAVAGYVCPAYGPKVAEVAAMAQTGMPCAESMSLSMDDKQPNLCRAHCQSGHQSADKYQTQTPISLGAFPADFSSPFAVPVFDEAALQAPHLQRTIAPPVSIRNCCFRL